MTKSYLPQKHNMSEWFERQTARSLKVTSFENELSRTSVCLLHSDKETERGEKEERAMSDKQSCFEMGRKMGQMWSCETSLMGGNKGLSHCAWNQTMASFWNISTCVLLLPNTSDQSSLCVCVSLWIWQLCEWKYD